jgi:hypothetical protein
MIITAAKMVPQLYHGRPALGCVFHQDELMIIVDMEPGSRRCHLRADKHPMPPHCHGRIAVRPRLSVFFL